MTCFSKYTHIPTETIEQDIQDTQAEIDQYRAELEPLRKNSVDNKMLIYIREGRILQSQEFINKLNEILDYRKEKL